MLLIGKDDYSRCFDGFRLLDCVVRKKDILCFVLMEDYDSNKARPERLEWRVIGCFLNKPENKRWNRAAIYNFDRLRAGASVTPKEQFVGVDLDGSVYVLGSGDAEIEGDISPWRDGGPLRGGIHKLRTIDGYLYATGGGRTVLRRDGKNNWFGFTKDIHDSKETGQGFEDIDGFSATDIYCVGGQGVVFHFNGKDWRELAFPSNMYLEAVCCAGDGQVYIGAQEGCVFKGMDNQWKRIHRDHMTLPFKDMVWYQGKVWCTSDYGLWTIENDKLKEADVPAQVRACAGNLSVADGVMLLAGMFGAAYHDGTAWHMLVSSQVGGQ